VKIFWNNSAKKPIRGRVGELAPLLLYGYFKAGLYVVIIKLQ
jgi:hypothetical protein